MAKGDRKHVALGARGKRSGAGAMSDLARERVEENAILSNRDKQQHTKERGQDSKRIQSEQHGDE
jgi:hypothetical protein